MASAQEARAEALSSAASLFVIHGALDDGLRGEEDHLDRAPGEDNLQQYEQQQQQKQQRKQLRDTDSSSSSNRTKKAPESVGDGTPQGAPEESENRENRHNVGVRRWTECLGPENVYLLPREVSGIPRASICVHDPDGMWPLIESEFLRRIQRVEYQWGGRVLRKLQVEIINPQHRYLSYHASSPLDSFKIPYLHIYLLKCDSLEEYKAAIRQRLCAWVNERKHSANGLGKTEFLVVYVPRLYHVADADKVNTITKKLLEKIRLDVNEGKEEHCARISLFQNDYMHNSGDRDTSSEAVASGDGEWVEMMSLVFRSITSAFELRCRKLEDMVLKLEHQVDVPGWNYCTYLIVKENLALCWLQIGQPFDALRILDSLAMHFDNIVEGDVEPKRSTNNLRIDLYRVQSLRLRLLGRHVGAPTSNALSEKEVKSMLSLESKPSSSSVGETSGPKAERGDNVLGTEGATQLMNQSKVVAARLARRLACSLSFGSSGTGKVVNRKRRTESTTERRYYQEPTSADSRESSGSVDTVKSSRVSEATQHPITPQESTRKLPAAPQSAKTAASEEFDDDGFVSAPLVSRSNSSHSLHRVPSVQTSLSSKSLPPIPCHVLDPHRKAYREQIYKSAVSILEVRLYLFMRSTLLLLAVNRADEALRRGLHFISLFMRDLLQASEKWDSDTEDHGDSEQPDRREGRAIALSWSIIACLELVAAGHAARAGPQNPDVSPDVFLYQSELIAFATSCYEELIAEVHGGPVPTSLPEQSSLSSRVWNKFSWVQQMPKYLAAPTAQVNTSSSSKLLTWLPLGLNYALNNQKVGIEFYSHLSECRASYLRLAGRYRSAFRIDFRNASLWVSHNRPRDARDTINRIEQDEISATIIRPSPQLRAEYGLLNTQVKAMSLQTEAAIRQALQVVSMLDAQHSQRQAALELALANVGKLRDELRLPGGEYSLLRWRETLPADIIENLENDNGVDGGETTNSTGNLMLSRRCGEVLSLRLSVNSLLPEDVEFTRVYVRTKRLPPRANLRVQIPVSSGEALHDLVRHRSSDHPVLPLTPLEAKPPTEAASGKQHTRKTQSPSGTDSEMTATPDPDLTEDDEDPWREHEVENLIKPSLVNSEEKIATLYDGPPTAEFSPPLRVNPAALRRVSISSRKSISERSPPAHNNSSRIHYFEADVVRIAPGKQDVVVVAPPSDQNGHMMAPGLYELDRVVFQKDQLRLVYPIKYQHRQFRIELTSMPPLFTVEVVRPVGSFLALDDVVNKEVEVELRLRKSDFARYPKLAGVHAKLDLDSAQPKRLPLLIEKDSVGNGLKLEASELDKGILSETGANEKTIKFLLKLNSSHSKEVDCLLQPNKADVQILRRKGFKENDSSLMSSWDLNVDVRTLLDQVDVKGVHHEVALDQTEKVTIKYGAPFEISQFVQFRAGRVWVQFTLRSNLPYTVTLNDAKLMLENDEFKLLERTNSRKACDELAPGHEVYLTFSSEAFPQVEPAEVHLLTFSTNYSPQHQKITSEGFFERTVAIRQEIDRRCLSIKSLCTNTEVVHLGSTATFVYHMDKPQEDKTVRVESVFAESTDLINVSASPLRKRHSSRRLLMSTPGGSATIRTGRKTLKTSSPSAMSPTDTSIQDAPSTPVTDNTDERENSSLEVEFVLAFDPTSWMIVGTERGHVDLTKSSFVTCEFIPLQAGELPFPVLEVLNFESKESGPRSFVRVSDA